MACGPPLLYLLISLSGSLIDALEPGQYIQPQVPLAGQCVSRNTMCITGYATSNGAGNVVQCAAFKIYDTCYRKNIELCKQEAGESSSSGSLSGGNAEFTAEAETFHVEYERTIKMLPRGCHVSLAPRDSSGSDTSGSSEIVLPTSVSSYASMPKSMRTRPVGSWSLYMTWWQWILFACCCCCCCCAGGAGAAMSGRRRNKPNPYAGGYDDQDQWAEPVPMYAPQQMYQQDPQQAYPLMPQNQSQGAYQPQGGSYMVAQGQGAFAAPYSYAAQMPTQYNVGQPRMY